jgi:predicted DNA-binding transcriptional regulator YafY
MRPTSRLFRIMLIIGRERVVTAKQIAAQLEVSLRTLYRDIKAITESGVPISSEAGVGYSLQKGFYLPPLMFTETEVQALALGVKMIQTYGDASMCNAANQALSKIEVSLPEHLKSHVVHAPPSLQKGLGIEKPPSGEH